MNSRHKVCVRAQLRSWLGLAALCLLLPSAQSEPSPTDLVDALNGVFGRHAGIRGSHARGICAEGHFEPSAEASTVARSRLFQHRQLPAAMRLSIGGGNPNLSDKSRSVRGLAARLQAGDETYDLVLISEPVFFASSPDAFVSFLLARTPDPATKKADPDKLRAHDAKYPSSRNQPALLASHTAPASYATTSYHSNHAFRFTNAAGQQTWARVIVEPSAGTAYLTSDREAALPDRFLEDELRQRLAQGSASFVVYAQPAGAGDSLTDPSVPWGNTGPPRVTLGRLLIDAITAAELCDKTMFVPTVLPDGIEPSDDPILKSRGPAYGISLGRRL